MLYPKSKQSLVALVSVVGLWISSAWAPAQDQLPFILYLGPAENFLLNGGGQVQQAHDLGDAGACHPSSPRQLGVVRDRSAPHQPFAFQCQREQSRHAGQMRGFSHLCRFLHPPSACSTLSASNSRPKTILR